ncbi:MAG: hypothetical protein CO095_17690 [Armatimonadetes bacterium CG_4_9_14_3_um_filter_58_7]|nr:MAG: hypothetical protein CO095_17690 [Armatimonadetes bacterium CG_4_9_14_3_um_filter_58_7]
MIRQTLYSIVVNAIEASAEGDPVGITASATDGELRIDVSDHGNGIPLSISVSVSLSRSTRRRPDARERGWELALPCARILWNPSVAGWTSRRKRVREPGLRFAFQWRDRNESTEKTKRPAEYADTAEGRDHFGTQNPY